MSNMDWSDPSRVLPTARLGDCFSIVCGGEEFTSFVIILREKGLPFTVVGFTMQNGAEVALLEDGWHCKHNNKTRAVSATYKLT